MATTLDVLNAAYANYARLLYLVTVAVANPTQGNVDTVVAQAQTMNVLTPKPTTTIDSEQYNWQEYQEFIITQMKSLKELMALESGPYEIRSVGM